MSKVLQSVYFQTTMPSDIGDIRVLYSRCSMFHSHQLMHYFHTIMYHSFKLY